MQLGKAEPTIEPEAFEQLLTYQWPGNIRELQNAIEYSVVLADKNSIGIKQLPQKIQLPPALQEAPMPIPGAPSLNLEESEKETILQALVQSHGNKKKAAEILGIHRPTLYGKMKRYGIEV